MLQVEGSLLAAGDERDRLERVRREVDHVRAPGSAAERANVDTEAFPPFPMAEPEPPQPESARTDGANERTSRGILGGWAGRRQ